MDLQPRLRRRLVWTVPVAAAAAAAGVVFIPGTASGSDAPPTLPDRTAAQLLADLEQADVPGLSGTVVSTTRLGLPSLPSSSTGGGVADGSGLAQVLPLLTGSHTLKVWYGGQDRQRLALMDNLAETDVVHNGTDVWVYDSKANAVTHATLPPDKGSAVAPSPSALPGTQTPEQAAQAALAAIDPTTVVTVDTTAKVAGRSAYQLVLTPRDQGSLIGSVRIAMDARTSMPLRVQVFGAGDTASPAVEIGFTDISFTTPADSVFTFSTPPGATVDQAGAIGGDHGQAAQPGTVPGSGGHGVTTVGTGWTAVAVVHGVDPKAADQLRQFATQVPGGQVVRSSLLSVLLTDDGTLYVGAVSPQALQQLAAGGTR